MAYVCGGMEHEMEAQAFLEAIQSSASIINRTAAPKNAVLFAMKLFMVDLHPFTTAPRLGRGGAPRPSRQGWRLAR